MSLPGDYIRLQWIGSTGTQYINTGLIPTLDYSIQVLGIKDSNASLFGSGDCSYVLTGNAQFPNYFYVGQTLTSPAEVGQIVTVTDQASAHIWEIRGGVGYCDGTTASEVKIGTTQPVYPLFLFARSKQGAFNDGGTHKIYAVKIWDESDALVRDLVPCFNCVSSKPGLYDLINNVFYTNQGTGEFVCELGVYKTHIATGPSSAIDSYKMCLTDKEIPQEYTELEYIESTGTQYIDTGYKPSSNTKVEIKMAMTAHKDWGHIVYAADDKGTGCRWGIMDGYKQYGTNSLRVDYCKYQNDTANKLSPFTYTINEPFIMSIYKGCTINGIVQSSTNLNTYKNTDFALSIDLYLFGGNYDNKISGDGSYKWNVSARMYYCKVYSDTGELYYNLIPAKRNSDGVLGMYDATKKVFLENKGAGSFVAGPVVNKANYACYKTIIYV